jgi:sulfur-oxidizing protein SoxX
MKVRYPDKSLLRDRIWDETKYIPTTVMPPFGRNKILTEKEIDEVVDFIYTL